MVLHDTGDVMPLGHSHSLSSYNTVAFHLPRLSRLSYQFLSHSWMLLCRQTHLVTSFRMCPRRRLINRTRFRVMWQCRRLPTVSFSYPWMRPRRRPHPVLCLGMSLRRWASRFASSFSVDVFVQTPVRSVVQHDVAVQLPITEFLLAVSSRTILWTAKTLFVSPRHQLKMILVVIHHL